MPSEDLRHYAKVGVAIRRMGNGVFGIGGYQRIVFTNGCFDILHPGHVSVFEKCRELAGSFGTVVVGVNSDASVKKLKGPTRPLLDCGARIKIVQAIRHVDHVVEFDEDTPLELIEGLRPDIVVKGGDYKPKDVVGNDLALVVIVPSVPGWSTTDIIRRSRE